MPTYCSKRLVSLFFAIVCLPLLWQWAVNYFAPPSYLLPSPLQVLQTLISDRNQILMQSVSTFLEWIIGLLLSILIGFVTALILFLSAAIRNILEPVLILSQSVPYLVFAPLLLLWLGLGILPKIVLVTLSCAFPIALVLEKGLTAAKNEYELLVTMLKLPWHSALLHVYLPAAAPDFFAGLRIAVSYAFVSCVLAEFMGSESGLGVYLTRAQSSYRADKVIAASILIVIITLASVSIVDFIKNKVVFWSQKLR